MTKREGLSLAGFFARYPTEESAVSQFEAWRWPDGPVCPRCDSANIQTPTTHPTMPYRCRGCRKFFSVTFGTIMQSTKLPLRTWLLAVYLLSTDAKGRASTKLGRDLDVQQRTAWHLAHRIRSAMSAAAGASDDVFVGPVQIDEVYLGGINKNRHANKRKRVGGGSSGKAPVVAFVDEATNRISAHHVTRVTSSAVSDLTKQRVAAGTAIHTDGNTVYNWLGVMGYQHEAVDHKCGEYVRDGVTTNAAESFFALLRRGYYGTHHHMSPKHLHRYVGEFAARHNLRPLTTVDRMALIAGGMEGERLRYTDLVATSKAAPVTATTSEQPSLPFQSGGVRWDS